MYQKKYSILLSKVAFGLALTLVFSCGTNRDSFDQLYFLEVKDSLSFEVNSQTVLPIYSKGIFQFIPKENRLAYLNVRNGLGDRTYEFALYDRSINLYDMKTGLLDKSVPLARTGKERILNNPDNFYYSSSDSIWVYPCLFDRDRAQRYPIGLLNDRGEVEIRIPLRNDDMNIPVIQGLGSIIKSKRNLVLSSKIYWKKSRMNSPLISLDIRKGLASIIKYKPKPYDEFSIKLSKGRLPDEVTSWADFGSLAQTSSVVNNSGDIVSNFPLDHRLWVLKSNGRIDRFEVISDYIGNFPIIEKRIKSRRKLRASVEASGRYIAILYDPVNEIYYRIGRLNFEQEELLMDINYRPDYTYTIMAINSEFQLLAETKLLASDYLIESGLFVAHGGLFVLRNDDSKVVMTFDKLVLTRSN